MKKQFLILVVLSALLFSTYACQLGESTVTTETNNITTGTYFMWRQQVFDYFVAIDFSNYSFTSIERLSHGEVKTYVLIDCDDETITEQVDSIFENYDYHDMFPTIYEIEYLYKIKFTYGNYEIRLYFNDFQDGTGELAIGHYENGVLVKGCTFSQRYFENEMKIIHQAICNSTEA